MSLSSMLRRMGEMGLSIDEAIELAEMWEKASAKAARGASPGAARTRRWREKKDGARHEERHEPRHDEGHEQGHGDVTASCARVRDISPDSEDTGSAAAAAAEGGCDWPKDPPGVIVKRLARMAGPGLADLAKAPGLTTTGGEITRWRQMGCSWELDVVPVVLGRTARGRRQPVASWIPFTADILAAKARREAPLPPPPKVEAGHAPAGTLSDRIGAENAEARRRALARVGAAHG